MQHLQICEFKILKEIMADKNELMTWLYSLSSINQALSQEDPSRNKFMMAV